MNESKLRAHVRNVLKEWVEKQQLEEDSLICTDEEKESEDKEEEDTE